MDTRAQLTIRYRTFGGGGPKVVLLHGGMQSSGNFRRLAAALQDRFTVYVPDRRGRGLSGPIGAGHGLATEVGDLDALLQETGARNVFGLSAGAVIALQAALELPAIERLALYEPPLPFGDVDPVHWLPRFEKELAANRKAAAFATVVNGTGDRKLPRAVLVPLMRLALRAEARAHRPIGHTPLGDLITTMRYDGITVAQSAGPLSRFAAVSAETLLLGGEKSAAYLKAALNGLEPVLPHVCRVTLPGVGHLAADDRGRPDLVAEHLRRFFGGQ
ncbi:MAG TPA: alpha/beta hydrolase [Actinoplanes sp.]|nr:alpha/beta hydrolase [Actinoplanes sp.]